MQNNRQKHKHLIITDGNGTISTVPNPYYVIAKKLGCYKKLKSLVSSYLDRQISYRRLIEQEVSLFKHYGKIYASSKDRAYLDQSLMNQLFDEICIELHKDVKDAVKAFHASHAAVVLISSGIDVIIKRIAANAGIQKWFANSIEYKNGMFEGIEVKIPGDKISVIQATMASENVVSNSSIIYVGENEFDFPAFEYINKVGGIAFAINRSFEHAPSSYPDGVKVIETMTDILAALK